MSKQEILMRCARKTCRYEWIYTGSNPWIVVCPRCKTSMSRTKNEVKEVGNAGSTPKAKHGKVLGKTKGRSVRKVNQPS